MRDIDKTSLFRRRPVLNAGRVIFVFNSFVLLVGRIAANKWSSNSVLNRGDHCEPIFRSGEDRELLLPTESPAGRE
jgi:hypothetical protein